MFCKYCGKEIENNAKFCNHCGKEVNSIKKERKEINKYDESIQEYMRYLEEKDGNKHVLLVEIVTIGQSKKVEEKYNVKINKIIKMMQMKGYEIIDIKLSMAQGSGFETLITYK